LKLAILLSEGGVFVDPGFIMTQPIETLFEEGLIQNGGFMFFNDHYTTDPLVPLFDSWFIYAGTFSSLSLSHTFSLVPQAEFIIQWFLEFSYVVLIYEATPSYLDHLEIDFGWDLRLSVVQASELAPNCLSLVSLQKVLRMGGESFIPGGISALKPPLGPLAALDLNAKFDTTQFINDFINYLMILPHEPIPFSPTFLYLDSSLIQELGVQTTQGLEAIKQYGFTSFWKKKHYQVNRNSFYTLNVLGMKDTRNPQNEW
jgi:hypothetical protein